MTRKQKVQPERSIPQLVCRQETVTLIHVHWKNLESFIESATGQKYDIVRGEFLHNDTKTRFDVKGKLNTDEKADWEAFKAGAPNDATLTLILNGLCKEGHLSKGSYMVSVCW